MKKKVSILIVEDEAISVLLLKDGLSAEGFEVCAIAATGRDAIIAAEAKRPDLIIMDVGLAGEMDGLEASAMIRRKCRAPIIFITGYTSEELLGRVCDIEPLAFLSKPVEMDELSGIIKAAFR
ncbi:MAG TPA: response regulator [Candidatus Wallbacteria bacterium]|nr:response regulator [Candidatus Wallbacteria bacterium]